MATKMETNDEFDNIESIDKPSTSATVEGVPIEVTKMKEPKHGTKRYFYADMSDGAKKIKLVGFEEEQQKQLATYKTSKSPVKIKPCEIQQGLTSGKLEIKLGHNSKILQSPKKFQLKDTSPTFASIADVKKLSNYERVDVRVKILKVRNPITVATGKTKQDLVVADKSGVITMTVWEQQVNTFEIGKCYEFLKLMVRIYDQLTSLSYPKEGASFTQIDNLDNVMDHYDEHDLESGLDYVDIEIGGVASLSKYNTCVKCSSKVTIQGKYARCTNGACKMFQAIDNTHATFVATLLLKTQETKFIEVRAFARELRQISNVTVGEITEVALIESPKFSCSVNKRNTISKVWRNPE